MLGRNAINIGNTFPAPAQVASQVTGYIFLACTEVAGAKKVYVFNNGSISYYQNPINQSFEHVLVDNIGTGKVRIAFNKLGLDLVNPMDGAKTLKSGDSLYINQCIDNITIYFVGSSSVSN